MEEDQFQEFISKISCEKKGLTYSDFVSCFQDLRMKGMGEVILGGLLYHKKS